MIVDPANYDAESGSLKATLKADYLETLDEGERDIKVVFDDGKAETTLTVQAAGEVTPPTGDSSHLGVYVSMTAVSLMGMLIIYYSLKRRQSRAIN